MTKRVAINQALALIFQAVKSLVYGYTFCHRDPLMNSQSYVDNRMLRLFFRRWLRDKQLINQIPRNPKGTQDRVVKHCATVR